jgi:DNA repair protein RadC
MNGTILYTTDSNAPNGFRRATLEEIMTEARQTLALRVRKGTELTSPQRARDYLMTRLANREFETFTLIYLDNCHRLIACEDLFRGTIDGASVDPREVVKEALKHNADAKSSARWRRRIQAHTFGSGR